MADIFSSWKFGGVMVDGYTFVEIRFYFDSNLTWSNFTDRIEFYISTSFVPVFCKRSNI